MTRASWQTNLLSLGLATATGIALALAQDAPARSVQADQAPAAPTDCPSRCLVHSSTLAHPPLLLAGEATTITLAVKAACVPTFEAVHVVFAIDHSSRMPPQALQEAREGLRALIDRMRLDQQPAWRVGLSYYDGGRPNRLALTNDRTEIDSVLDGLRAGGKPQVDDLLESARAELLRARVPDCARSGLRQFVVLISPEIEVRDCAPIAGAARDAKRAGLLSIVIDASDPPDDDRCLRALASSSRYLYQLDQLPWLIEAFYRIYDEPPPLIPLRQLEIVDHLPEGVELVEGGAWPPPKVDPTTGELRWQQNFVPRDGVTFTFQVRPTRPGFQPLTEGARLTWRDAQNRSGTRLLDPSWAQVFAPRGVDP